MEPITTYQDYKSTIDSDEKIVIKFYAGWCPDCTALNMFIPPILEKFESTTFYELNRDEVEDAATENDVMGIPSLLVFKNGEKLAHLHSRDAKTPEQVEAFLSEHL